MSDYRVALHEAGHAWVAHTFGIEVMGLSIVSTADHDGYCQHGLSAQERPWREHAAIALGGIAAQVVAQGYMGSADVERLANGEGMTDFHYAMRVTGSHGQHKNGVLLVNLSRRFLVAWGDALDIARAKMIYIERLARLLLRHGRMGKCCDPAITYFAEGHEMPNWHYCPWCGVKLAESEAIA